jgi:hypothetical protein
MKLTRGKRIVISLLTSVVLATILIYTWINFSENIFLIVLLGIIFSGMALEYTVKLKGVQQQSKDKLD